MNREEVKEYLRELYKGEIDDTGEIVFHTVKAKWICEVRKGNFWFIVDVNISEFQKSAF